MIGATTLLVLAALCAPGAGTIDADTGRVSVDGGTLFYDDRGAGPVIVLMHAGGRDHTMWDAQARTFTRGFRVIRFDLRGHGRSTARLGPFSLVDDLRRVLDHLQVEHARLVGVSMGSGVALDAAFQIPDRVDRIVLVSYAGSPPGVPTAPGSVDPRTPEGQARLAELSIPVLVVVGERDAAATHALADILAGGVQDGEKVVIGDAGHLPSLDQPADFDRQVLRFLRQRRRGDDRGRAP
ncbi:MAG TPA: alpha/beta fold hydrolase [Longimicrobium sp.]|nr:alpha/beta fold hydrolase [Longimicrobium sp.]